MHAERKELNFGKNFEVALLIEDLGEAKEISDALRELGIYAHYYGELDEFWVAANAQTPDFAIVDVKKMSQGSMLFKNHPKALNGSMAFSFFYSNATSILVSSTFELNHYGLIQKELDLVGQISSVLGRRQLELGLLDENHKLGERIERLQKRSNRILKDSQDTFAFEKQMNTLLNVSSRLGKANSKQDYLDQVITVFSAWEDCDSFGVYTLNTVDQKLVSPKAIRKGYETLPELWLTRPGETGIDDYAQEMACEVAFDIFDQDPRVLRVKGSRENPEILILASFNEQNLSRFPWELFEERLSYAYSKLLFSELDRTENESHFMSVWDSFNYLDDIYFHQASGMHKLADIDLSRLLEAINEKHGNRFSWKAFQGDFMGELERNLSGDFKISPYGAQSVMVFIDKKNLEHDYQKLKAVVEDFQYWRYFQDTSMMMARNMFPQVRLLAPSSVNYLRQAKSSVESARKSVNKSEISGQNPPQRGSVRASRPSLDV